MREVKLVGADTCRRYRRMRELVLDEAARAGIQVALREETEVDGILKYRTANLPLLFIDGRQVAQGNPPSRNIIREHLQPQP
jgi:hypothetical protein